MASRRKQAKSKDSFVANSPSLDSATELILPKETTSISCSFLRWSSVLVFIVSLVLQANTYGAQFTYDDARGVVANPDLKPETSYFNILKNDFWG